MSSPSMLATVVEPQVLLPLTEPRRLWRLRLLAIVVYYGVLLAAVVAVEGAAASFGLGNPALLTAGSMLGAILLTVPLAWVRFIGSPEGGKDRTVLETLVMLPAAVAAIVMIVRNDLTLALSLAGIVAAVRFRNNLKESADAVYVFVAVGLGLAAGTQALLLGVVMSAVFSAIVLTIARLKAASEPLVLARGSIERIPAAESPGPESLPRDGKRKAVLLVWPAPRRPAWRPVEDALRKHAKRWRLVEVPPDADADAPLEYRIRLRRKTSLDRLMHEVKRRGGSDILAAELRPA